ncbi:MAG: molybdate ABC transporter ATP-binding protein ModF [SAR324 cluster bacterium]|nr:molybdate ABC transporter ATP-binding protein ModF [SAR324 cluster bacterium]
MENKNNRKPLVILNQITAIVRGRKILANTSWVMQQDQNWAIIGPNGAGKSSLCRILLGKLPVCSGTMTRHPGLFSPGKISYVSFDTQKRLMRQELVEDTARYYKGSIDEVTTVQQAMFMTATPKQKLFEQIVEQLELQSILDKGIGVLSHGEMRKFLIGRGMMTSPKLLILDEPFDGLDAAARKKFLGLINHLMEQNLQILLITHRFEEIPGNVSHVLCLKDCSVFAQGKKQDMLASQMIQRLYETSPRHRKALINFSSDSSENTSSPLVIMKEATVQYGEVTVLDRVNWTMNSGENWAILGPNGAGKSTLLRLIAADHPQAYSNEIYLFGKRRGSGESVWDIKKHIGLVSPEFQIRYQSQITVRQVVLSGFFDSIGIYQVSSLKQREIARQWIEQLSMDDKIESPFDRISQGEQRMVLLARAMVKCPLLLILDEPCQGLDYTNRQLILDLIDWIGTHTQTNILYVSHHNKETPECIDHVLAFEPAPNGSYSVRCDHL